MQNTLLEFRKIQRIKARIEEIRVEMNSIDGRTSPEEYNLRAKLAFEMRQLQEQLLSKRVKLM